MSRFYVVRYGGFLQAVERTFGTLDEAELWCRQIGRKDLIPTIVKVDPNWKEKDD